MMIFFDAKFTSTKKHTMKKTVTNAIAIFLVVIACTANTNAKNPATNDLVGTWVTYKVIPNQTDYISSLVSIYCQFNANGTYAAFTYNRNKVELVGNGNWVIKDNKISMITTESKGAFVDFEIGENTLKIDNKVTYVKTTTEIADNVIHN